MPSWAAGAATATYNDTNTTIYAARSKLNAFRVGSWFNNRTDGESLLRILKTRYEGQFPVSFNFANGRFGWDYTGVPEVGTAAVAAGGCCGRGRRTA